MKPCNAHNLFNVRTAGFTLAETLVAIAVVGILAAIAAPNFLNWITQTRIAHAATQLSGALQVSQREAMRRGKVCALRILDGREIMSELEKEEEKRRKCLIIIQEGEQEPVDLDELRPAIVQIINLENNIRVNSNLLHRKVRFGFRGNTTDAGTILVYAEGSDARAKCVVTSIGIGMIREGDYVGDINAFDPNQCQSN